MVQTTTYSAEEQERINRAKEIRRLACEALKKAGGKSIDELTPVERNSPQSCGDLLGMSASLHWMAAQAALVGEDYIGYLNLAAQVDAAIAGQCP